MKRLILFIISLTITRLLFSQVYKSGTISSPETWSGIVYLSGNVTITSSVTINAGTKVLFKGNRAIKLIIDGAGSVTATGSSGNEIYFSADDDEDGVYGENNERGLKIQLYPSSGSSGSSSFTYCIFEYIDCSNESGNNAYGALDMVNRPVTIENSVFRNNRADYGGAIFLRNNSNLTLNECTFENNDADYWGGALYFGAASGVIKNCILKNNSASSGGGFYVYQGGPSFTNCLIYSNSATGSGSGIYLNQANSSFKMVNTTCSKNINSGSVKDFQFNGVSGQQPKIVNSIIWGSNIGTLDANLITIVNCAIQGFTNYNSHVASISLSSNNTGDSASPYFSNPGGYDFSLFFVSPCRDAGVNTYTGVTIPTSDYRGNGRIGNKDMGALEVLYSRWKTDPSDIYTWTSPGNWEQGIYPTHPDATEDIIIPYLSSSAYAPDVSSVSVQLGKYMILEPGAKASIGTLTNNGTFRMESDATGISSLIVDSYSGNDAEVELYLTGGMGSPSYRWHLISSPFNSLSTDPITSVTKNLAGWVESETSEDLSIGWIAYDGYVYNVDTDPPYSGTDFSFDKFNQGSGYNYYYSTNYTYTLSGILNTADVPVTLSYTLVDPDAPSRYGWNALGNPFSSALDWDEITFGAFADDYPPNTSKVLHLRREGKHVYYINGVGSEPGVTGIIPPLQGFFTKTYSQGNIITLPAGARTHGTTLTRYKGNNKIPLVRLKLQSNDLNDYLVVRFDEKAKTGLDLDFDAEKALRSSSLPYLYTLSGETKFAINGQPFLLEGASLELPVGINITKSGTHTISATEIENLPEYKVFLRDNLTGSTVDLKAVTDYSFSASEGLYTNRFILIISNITTSINDLRSGKSNIFFNIYQAGSSINLQPLTHDWDGLYATVRILDLTGRIVSINRNVELRYSSLVYLPSPALKGIYIIDISSGLKKYSGKIVIQ